LLTQEESEKLYGGAPSSLNTQGAK
jgi:hypothetical protein